MIAPGNPRAIAGFAIRFLLASLVLLPAWWLAAPMYGELLVQGCGVILRDFLAVPLTAGHVDVAGIMNTESQLVFYRNTTPTSMRFVQLVTNVPPFLALLVATPGLSFQRKCLATVIGTAVLCLGHALFIILALRFSTALARSPEIPTALTQFFLTLPFLLWIVLAYWQGQEAESAPSETTR